MFACSLSFFSVKWSRCVLAPSYDNIRMKSWLPSSAPSSYYESALSSWPYPRLAKRFQANLFADQTDQTTSKRLGSMIPMARIGKRFDQTNEIEGTFRMPCLIVFVTSSSIPYTKAHSICGFENVKSPPATLQPSEVLPTIRTLRSQLYLRT